MSVAYHLNTDSTISDALIKPLYITQQQAILHEMYSNRNPLRAKEMVAAAMSNYRLPKHMVSEYGRLYDVLRKLTEGADKAEKLEGMADAKVAVYKNYILHSDKIPGTMTLGEVERKVDTWEDMVKEAKQLRFASDEEKEKLFEKMMALAAEDVSPGFEKKDSLEVYRAYGHARHSSL